MPEIDKHFEEWWENWSPEPVKDEYERLIAKRAWDAARRPADTTEAEIIAAAKNLVRVKGRYNTEQAMKRLIDAVRSDW
jgi:hypothetical protein